MQHTKLFAALHLSHTFSTMTTSQTHRSKAEVPSPHSIVGANTKLIKQSSAQHGPTALCMEPSSSSNGSDHCRHPSRASSPAIAGTKSAKRRAAEALLAAQYVGLNSSSLGNTGLKRNSSVLQQHAGFATDAAAAGQQQHGMPSSKRHQSMLNTAISRLRGQQAAVTADSAQEHAAAAAALGAQATANSQLQRAQHDALQQVQAPQQQRQQQQVVASGSSWQPSHTAHAAAAHLASADSTAGDAVAAAAGHVISVEAAGAAKQQGHQGQHHQAAVVVPACGADCQHTFTQGWCHSQVGLCQL